MTAAIVAFKARARPPEGLTMSAKEFQPALVDVPGARWFVVHTRARAERQAYDRLLEQGFAALYLHVRYHMRLKGRIVTYDRPYWSRYLFAGVHGRLSCYAVNSTPGVSTLLHGMDGRPLDVPSEIVAGLAAQADAFGMMPAKPPPLPPAFVPRDTVRVKRGPFEGHNGTVESVDGPLVRLWISVLGGPRTVTMTVDMVEMLAAERREAA
jgi:transcription antitermination factor NusG